VYRNSPKITNPQKSTSSLPSPSNIGARSKETNLHFSYKHEVVQKEENKKLVTQQTEWPFKRWESVQEFQGIGKSTHVKHAINYELSTTGKIANLLSGSQADNKLREDLEQAANTVKQKLESDQS
jgi:ribosome-associated toxin RatA of RatAB toxin-antitoxin module